METFEIVLKNEKERFYRLIILLIIALHALFFIYLLFDQSLWKKGVGGLVVIGLYTIYRLIVSKISEKRFQYEPSFFFIMGVVGTTFTWLWVIDLIFGVLSTIALQKIMFYFNKSSIEKRNVPVKKYLWNDFDNIVLKDNILTLDFKNNKLLQAEIDSSNINEVAFNTFAKAHLNK